MEQLNFEEEEEENVGIDKRSPELIDTKILVVKDELESGKAERCDEIAAEIVEVCKRFSKNNKN